MDPRPLNLVEMLKRLTRGKLLRLLGERKVEEELEEGDDNRTGKMVIPSEALAACSLQPELTPLLEMQVAYTNVAQMPFPKHIPAWFDYGYGTKGVTQQDLNTNSYELASFSPSPLAFSSATSSHSPSQYAEGHALGENGEESQESPLQALMEGCSMVVGMHPDQATEAIVDFALAMGKPFAVVPCCVFPKLFSWRRLEGGAPVRTHEEFVEYLRSKCPQRIKVTTLDFVGRNTVVYAVP